MMRSGGLRRLRLVATLALGVVMIWLWRRNTAIMDVYRQYGAVPPGAIGGGSVLRPGLQRPEQHEPAPKPSGHPAPDLTLPEASSSASPLVDDQHIDPEDAPEAESIDDLLHSEAGMADKEGPSSTKASATPKATPAPGLDILPSMMDEEDNPYGAGLGRVEVPVIPSHTTATAVHWSKQPQLFPISSTIQLPTGTSKPFPRIQREMDKLSMSGADEDKLRVVKEAMAHSWKGYRLFAFQDDEVRPVSHTSSNPFNGWGATLVDSLDTLWVMGMEKEFEEAVQAVGQIDFTTSLRSDIPLFETVIRYLGGLVAAYDVSGKKHRTLLDKAVELAEVLYGAFDTPNRVPLTYYRWKPISASQPHRAGSRVILAEVGTLSLEFTRLAQLTGEPKYYDAIARLTDQFEEWQNNTRLPGMWPTSFDASGCGEPLQPPSSTTSNQQPVPANDPPAGPGAGVATDDLQRSAQPGPLTDDGVGVHEAEDELYNEEAHGNTFKRKRQVEEEGDGLSSDAVVEHGVAEADNSSSDRTNLTDGQDNDALHENELRAPPDVATTRTTVRDDSNYCAPQGFASTSKNGQETFTLSGASDSMYEYLTKEYLLLGGQVDKYRTMYLDSAEVAIEKLLYRPMTIDERDILLTGDLKISPNYSKPVDSKEYIERFSAEAAHLACFTGGMFAMGGVIFDQPEHLAIASKLTDGCVWMYDVTPSGIMPEQATVVACEDTWGDCPWNETAYWAALDPYAQTRAQTAPIVDSPATQHAGAGTARQRMAAESDDTLGNNLNEHSHDEARGSDDSLAKRQLDAVAEDEERQSSSTSDSESTPTTSAESTAYTPPPPLTHEEFVAKKIEDERLPPGFVHINQRKYILRPEAIESVFYMYRITGDPHWREVGWDMFRAIERHTRAEFGYSAIHDITKEKPEHMDQMESFWLAETLKYFYLLYDDPSAWSLDEWVLNTEAHLFRRPTFDFVDG